MKTTGNLETVATAPDGSDVLCDTIGTDGLRARVLSFGGVLQDLRLEGDASSLVLGFSDPSDYFINPGYVGAIVGRYGNRIRDGFLSIKGTEYQLDLNESAQSHLHGGSSGFSHRNWTLRHHDETTAVFTLQAADQEMGYPGNLDVTLTYEVLPGQRLSVRLEAVSDQPTVINPVPHFYFKLDQNPTIVAHHLRIFADSYLPVDDALMPTGAPKAVQGSGFDFLTMTALGDASGDASGDQTSCKDLDHNFCFTAPRQGLIQMARLVSARTQRAVDIYSDTPGLQVYTGSQLGKSGVTKSLQRPLLPFEAIALEPQYWPNSPNMPSYPSAIYDSEQSYSHRHDYVFS